MGFVANLEPSNGHLIMMKSLLPSVPVNSLVMSKLRAYVALTKPRVIELLLVTTVPAMILANYPNGFPNIFLVINVLIGGALSAGSANAFNCYIDADIDKIMGRTKNRPLVTGELSKREALVFAYATAFVSSAYLWFTAGWLSAVLSLSAIAFYVLVYTLLLKRKTPQNIVWGGAAGAMPVLIGWAAATKDLSVAAWLLFLVIFLWTPPHYWPLSMKYRDDYAAAGVPMLPVVRNPKVVGAQILLYTWAMVASSLLLIPAAGMGVIYAITAAAFGVWFTVEATILYRQSQTGIPTSPMRLFHGSISYLTVLFLAIAVDPLVHIAIFS